jgi:hypothetical protein
MPLVTPGRVTAYEVERQLRRGRPDQFRQIGEHACRFLKVLPFFDIEPVGMGRRRRLADGVRQEELGGLDVARSGQSQQRDGDGVHVVWGDGIDQGLPQPRYLTRERITRSAGIAWGKPAIAVAARGAWLVAAGRVVLPLRALESPLLCMRVLSEGAKTRANGRRLRPADGRANNYTYV